MIVASAILYPDGEVVTARRHHQVIAIQAKFGIKSIDCVQGFIDHTGRFYTRDEAKVIARENGQIPKTHTGMLHSEDLWPDPVGVSY